jgi:hypothetical protein
VPSPPPMPQAGPRVLGFGRTPEIAAAIEGILRQAGYRATTFTLSDDDDGDARLVAELQAERYDAVGIGGAINGQSPDVPASEQSTIWFNRVLDLIAEHAPGTKVVLVRGPDDALPALERVLGRRVDS